MNSRATNLVAALGAALAISWTAVPVRAELGQSPEATAKAFYGWYLHELAQNHEPFLKDKPGLRKFVTAGLLNELQRRFERPEGLSEDYFLQAQDWLEDWESNISTTKAAVNKTTATTVVILGAKEDSRHKLRVSLRLESGGWRIAAVHPLR